MTHSAPEIDTKSAISENTPLLGASADEPFAPLNDSEILNHEAARENDSNGPRPPQTEKPLPKLQIFLLCYARTIEPIAFFGIFPFISKMIFETGNLEEADVGFYAGLIVSPNPPPPLYLTTKIELGINVLANADAVDDSMGSRCRPDWQETGARFLARGSGDRDGDFWAQ